jgi:predicted outer membrane repeat protein
MSCIHAENNTASYSNLTDEIDALDDNATLNLTSDYQFNNVTDDRGGVVISKNLSISANNASIDGSGQARGFFIKSNCNVVIENMTFKNCFCSNDEGGGAIFLSSNSNLTLKNCIFKNNKVYNANGAAIKCQKLTNADIYSCTFSNNTCIRESDLEWEEYKRGMGSAVFMSIGSNLKLYDSIFNDNNAYLATVLVVSYTGTERKTSTLYVRGCLFENNTSRSMTAIYLDEFGIGEILDSVFRNNRATYSGGTICLDSSLSATVRNCLFESNHAIKGGALYIVPFDGNGSRASISDCNFSENVVSENGGAIYANSASAEIVNCNFLRNTASGKGGGIFTYGGSVRIADSQFINNRAKQGGGAYFLTDNTVIQNVAFNANTATEKYGGVYSKSLQVSVSNCQFKGNVAPAYPDIYGAFSANAVQTGSYYAEAELSIVLKSPWWSPSQSIRLVFNGTKSYKSQWISVSSNGVFKYDVPLDLKSGKYTLKIMSNSGKCYSNLLTFNILKAPLKVIVKKTSVRFNSGKILKIKAINSKTNKAVAFAKVKLRVYTNKAYKTFALSADGNGIIEFDTSKLSVGKHAVKVLAGDGNVEVSKNAKFAIKVSRGSCKVVYPKTIKRHSSLKVEILKTVSKKPISKTKFKVKINYRVYKLKTSSKGILKVPASKLPKGKYLVKIVLDNRKYNIHKRFNFRIA